MCIRDRHEAVTVGKCRIYGLETVIGVCDARFMMSSMGHVVGEKIALAVEHVLLRVLSQIRILR